MRVILRENIENLGKKGDIVNVAPGYGRNYLIPKKIAIEVTSRNMKLIEIEQQALQKGLEKEMASYQEIIDRLNAVTLSFARKTSEKDVIFGSVSSTDIRDALADQGFDVEKKKIILEEPIKRLGNYTVPIKIFHDEKAEVKLEVIKEGEPRAKEDEVKEAELVEEKASVPIPADETKVIQEEAIPKETEKSPEDEAGKLEETKEAPREEIERLVDTKESPEALEEIPEKIEEPEAPDETQIVEDEKAPTEEASLEDTQEVPLETHEESLKTKETEPEDAPEESEIIPGETEKPSGEPEKTAEDNDSEEAASKDNK